jgi:hypothetical protein
LVHLADPIAPNSERHLLRGLPSALDAPVPEVLRKGGDPRNEQEAEASFGFGYAAPETGHRPAGPHPA